LNKAKAKGTKGKGKAKGKGKGDKDLCGEGLPHAWMTTRVIKCCVNRTSMSGKPHMSVVLCESHIT